MNRAIAAIYAISITHDGRDLTPEENAQIVAKVPALIEEVRRLEEIVNDPIIAGYLTARRSGLLKLGPALTS